MNRQTARAISRSPEIAAYDQIITALSLLARGATAKVTVDGPDGESACIAIPEPLAIMSLRQVRIDAGNRLAAVREMGERCLGQSSRMRRNR